MLNRCDQLTLELEEELRGYCRELPTSALPKIRTVLVAVMRDVAIHGDSLLTPHLAIVESIAERYLSFTELYADLPAQLQSLLIGAIHHFIDRSVRREHYRGGEDDVRVFTYVSNCLAAARGSGSAIEMHL